MTAYEEQPGSPVENLTKTGIAATRTLMCAWADRWALATELSLDGGAYPHDTSGMPTLDPDTLKVQSISINPFEAEVGGVAALAEYEKAIVTVRYGTETAQGAEITADGRVKETFEPSAEFLTLDPKNFAWGNWATGDKLKDGEAPGEIYLGGTYCLTRYDLLTMPDTLHLIGTTNSDDIQTRTSLMRDIIFKAGSLMFQPPSISPRVNEKGILMCDAAYRFPYKPMEKGGWNTFWRAKTGAYESLYNPKGKFEPYPPASWVGI